LEEPLAYFAVSTMFMVWMRRNLRMMWRVIVPKP